MVLTSPGGQQVTLIGPNVSTFGFTGPFPWEITFLPCGDVVSPDPGFNPTWDNDQPWALGAMYDGSYYPFLGCLEDFNTGTVDGVWTLTVVNNSPVNTAEIIDFSVIFCCASLRRKAYPQPISKFKLFFHFNFLYLY